MKTIISEQQASFFTHNGFIEFEIPHLPFSFQKVRDQWREDPSLKEFVFKKLAPIALALTGKEQIRMGLSSWITEKNRPQKAIALKEMFNIQNLVIGISIAQDPKHLLKRSPLGILPLPAEGTQILFFRPEFLLDWPRVKSDLLLVAFASLNAIFIHNPNDPDLSLKKFGYQFGDLLKNKTHPIHK